MAHQGKATSTVDWHPEDPAESYTNEGVSEHHSQYTEMARAVHGPEYDPTTANLDGEIVMRVGEGKKHGWYWIGNSTLDSASTPTLSQIRARSTSASPAIRTRPETSTHRVAALQVISVLFIVHWFTCLENTCNNGMKHCTPSWNKRGSNGRRWRRGWRLSMSPRG
jgi:hypothetical protein